MKTGPAALRGLMGPSVWSRIAELHALEHAIRSVRLEIERTTDATDVSHLVELVAAEFEVTVAEIRSRGRTAPVALARQVCMVLCLELLGRTNSETARIFNRDHGTVCGARRAVANELETSTKFAERVQAIRKTMLVLTVSGMMEKQKEDGR